jgi:hypothetical protein
MKRVVDMRGAKASAWMAGPVHCAGMACHVRRCAMAVVAGVALRHHHADGQEKRRQAAPH